MADDYYRFVERAHVLKGENTGKIYRLGDRVKVQVVKVDMERRQIDLGLSEILERRRASRRRIAVRAAARRSRAASSGSAAGPRRTRRNGGSRARERRSGLKRRQ